MHAEISGINAPADHTALIEWRARVVALPSVKNRSGQQFAAEDLKRLGF
jgi:hypothetical protein